MTTTLRWAGAACVLLVASCGGGGPPWHIEGSARLPSCTEPPSFDFDGTRWVDRGTVRITSPACEELRRGDEVGSCGLAWDFRQQGSELDILVDDEYQIFGRMCGDRLHLQGGWWLAVETEQGFCTYEDDYAQEVVIEQGGSTLAISQGAPNGTASQVVMNGRLRIRSRDCAADYDVTFDRL